MLRTFILMLATLALIGCGAIEADAEPYFDGVFVGYYLTDNEATPIAMRLELTASEIRQKRYTITGTATLGTETFTAKGYELASPNLDYLAPQAAPPPMGDSIIEFQDAAGTTAYTLCTSLIYRDYEGFFRISEMNFFEGPPLSEPVPSYCIWQKGFAKIELGKVNGSP